MRIRLHYKAPRGEQKTERRYGAVRKYIAQVASKKRQITAFDLEFRLGYTRAQQNLIEMKNEGRLRLVKAAATGRNAKRSPAQYALV